MEKRFHDACKKSFGDSLPADRRCRVICCDMQHDKEEFSRGGDPLCRE